MVRRGNRSRGTRVTRAGRENTISQRSGRSAGLRVQHVYFVLKKGRAVEPSTLRSEP